MTFGYQVHRSNMTFGYQPSSSQFSESSVLLIGESGGEARKAFCPVRDFRKVFLASQQFVGVRTMALMSQYFC